jgi:hypothetical protein
MKLLALEPFTCLADLPGEPGQGTQGGSRGNGFRGWTKHIEINRLNILDLFVEND